jgi:hypothetical protein
LAEINMSYPETASALDGFTRGSGQATLISCPDAMATAMDTDEFASEALLRRSEASGVPGLTKTVRQKIGKLLGTPSIAMDIKIFPGSEE